MTRPPRHTPSGRSEVSPTASSPTAATTLPADDPCVSRLAALARIYPTGYSLPSDRQVARWWKEHRQPGPPPRDADPRLLAVEALVRRHWGVLRRSPAWYPAVRPAPSGRSEVSPTASSTPGGTEIPGPGWTTEELAAWALAHGVQWTPHPTNRGLSAMRLRNAVAAKIRLIST